MKSVKFDTRDVKPKLWNLLIVSVLYAAVVGFLVLTNPESAGAICVITAAYCLITASLLLYSFREQMRYNPYSYNTIIYFGFALFSLAVMVMHVLLAVNIFRQPDLYKLDSIVSMLLASAKTYMFISSPFLIAFSVALCISNISLIRHERKRFVNFLGILLSILIVGGIVLLYWVDYYVSGSQFEVMMHDLFTCIGAAIYLYFECMLLGTVVASAIAAKHEPDKDKDFIIILGCGIKRDGTPTPLLRGRIDRAIDFAREQEKETGKSPLFVTSGGQGADETISESECMKNYLISRGIPHELIIEENKSTTTLENMKFSKEKIFAINPDAKIVFSTTNYHVFRAGLFARRVKMRAQGMGARTKWYFWPNAAVREFIDLLTKHRGKQLLILGGMIAFYVIMTLIAYE